MKQPSFILRPMEASDIGSAMKLSNSAGWNQTERDWKLLMENPRNFCMLAECDNKVIGTTTAINYSNQVAWIGMVLVDKAYRGQGVSKLLLTNILNKSGAIQSIKLDATPEGQPVYKKFDFKDEHFIVRMANSSLKNIVPGNNNDPLPEAVQLKDIAEVIAMDQIIFGADRTQLITALVNEYPGKSWVLRKNNRITGFVLGRDGNQYQQIGPVVASGTMDAKILITTALSKLADRAVIVDVLEDKEVLIRWLNSIGFIKQRRFTRMYKNENTRPGITGQQYLIAGPEFG